MNPTIDAPTGPRCPPPTAAAPINRAGYRMAKICTSCNVEIDANDQCKCGPPLPFAVKGTEVTLCSDNAGLHPIGFAIVSRIANGAVRIDRGSRWFNIATGIAVHAPSGCIRARRDGDSDGIAKHEQRMRVRVEIEAIYAKAKAKRDHAAGHVRDAARYLKEAAAIDADAATHDRQAAGCRRIAKNRREDATVSKGQADRLLAEATALEAQAKAIDKHAALLHEACDYRTKAAAEHAKAVEYWDRVRQHGDYVEQANLAREAAMRHEDEHQRLLGLADEADAAAKALDHSVTTRQP